VVLSITPSRKLCSHYKFNVGNRRFAILAVTDLEQ
jgi:hypothetical protein